MPTAHATELAEPVADILARVGAIVANAQPFDPKTSTRRFVIGTLDALAAVFLPDLLSRLRQRAPGVCLAIREPAPEAGAMTMERGGHLLVSQIGDAPTPASPGSTTSSTLCECRGTRAQLPMRHTLRVEATQPNCAKHPWQPALGACARCGDFTCMRCGTQRAGAVVCHVCSERVPAAAEAVPHDADGPWLQSMRTTSLLVWREPFRLFARLADGPVNPAWNFATWWCGAMSLVRSLFELHGVSKSVGLALISALSAGLHLLVVGTLFYGLARALGGTISWSLSARAQGYSGAWIGPGTLLQLLADQLAPSLIVWWIFAGAGVVLAVGGTASAFFGIARGRGQLPPARAALISALAVFPQLLLHFAVMLALSLRATG